MTRLNIDLGDFCGYENSEDANPVDPNAEIKLDKLMQDFINENKRLSEQPLYEEQAFQELLNSLPKIFENYDLAEKEAYSTNNKTTETTPLELLRK